VRGFQLVTAVSPAVARDWFPPVAQEQDWTLAWTSPWSVRLEKGSTGSDIVLGPWMPHQVVSCEVRTGPQGETQVVVVQTQARWYGGTGTEPRKAKRQFNGLAEVLAQRLSTPAHTVTPVPFAV
jgi:hypothetical protein